MINRFGEDPIHYITHPVSKDQIKLVRRLDPDTLEEIYYKEVTVNGLGNPISDADVDDITYIKRNRYYFKRVKSVLDLNSELQTNIKRGKSSQSVSAVTTVTIAHGLGKIPDVVLLTPGSSVAGGYTHATADATNISVIYGAGITGTWDMNWQVS